jgi:hypothetical protein
MSLIKFIIVDSAGNEHCAVGHGNKVDNDYVIIWSNDYEHSFMFYKPVSVTFFNLVE